MKLLRLPAAAALVAVLSLLLGAGPAGAATVRTPRSLTGFAFDTCRTPDQATMDAWLRSSPFWAVGVYLGGDNRLDCLAPDETDNLTSGWVSTQASRGWRVLPLWVGPQAACTGYASRIDADPANRYAAARAQGRRAANQAVAAARSLGIGPHSTLWYDLEDFDLQASDDCRRSALSALSAWTRRLHAVKYVSGVYSNVAAGVHALDYADTVSPKAYTEPDQIWFAWANGRASTAIPTKWVRSSSWTPHERVHQYAHDVERSYGGVSLSIDQSFLDLGRGSVAPAPAASCGVRVSFRSYGALHRGSRGARVRAAQCLLRQRHYYRGRVTGHYDKPTWRATRRLQADRGLAVTGTMNRRAWTALLASGRGPLLKRGSAEEPVRRLQRALNAARHDRLAVSGVFTAATAGSVRAYQKRLGLAATGVVTREVWNALRHGRR